MTEYLTEELGLSPEMAEGILARVSVIQQERDEAVQARENAETAMGTLRAEYDAHRKETAVFRALSDAGARNITAARALLDTDEITESETGFSGLLEQVEKIKNDCPYLFRVSSVSGGMRHGPDGSNTDSFTQFARTGAKLK